MQRLKNKRLCAIVLVVLMAACGPLAGLRAGLRAGGPLVDRLAAQGVFPREKAQAIRTDFADGLDVAERLQANWNPKAQRPAAAHQAFTEWRAIYDRGNFGSDSRIQSAADIADSVFLAIELFYNPGQQAAAMVKSNRATRSAVSDSAPQTEAELDAFIKRRSQELKRALEAQ